MFKNNFALIFKTHYYILEIIVLFHMSQQHTSDYRRKQAIGILFCVRVKSGHLTGFIGEKQHTGKWNKRQTSASK